MPKTLGIFLLKLFTERGHIMATPEEIAEALRLSRQLEKEREEAQANMNDSLKSELELRREIINAQAEAMNPALLTMTITLSVLSLSVVLMIPELFSNDNLASNTSGFDCNTRITLPVQQPQVIP